MSVSGETPTNRKVHRDLRFDSTSTQVGLQVPIVDTSATPSSTNVNARNVLPKGKLATDRSDCCLYLSDGKQWNLVGGNAGSNSCRIGLSADVAGVGNAALIPWDLVESDPAGMYSTTTNLITVPQTGVYEISSTLCASVFSAAPHSFVGLDMRINGNAGSNFKSTHPITLAGDFSSAVLHKQLALDAGDTIELRFNIDAGTASLQGGVDAEKGTARASWFSVRRIE